MKYQQLFKFSLLILCLVIGSQATTHKKATLTSTGSGAWNSCRNWRFLAPGSLTGECQYDGFLGVTQYKDSTVELNNCLGNIDGQFKLKNTNFALSAFNVTFDGRTLRGDLYNAVGNWSSTSIDLNSVLGNNQGNLVC